jgi:hypothetical protein
MEKCGEISLSQQHGSSETFKGHSGKAFYGLGNFPFFAMENLSLCNIDNLVLGIH